VSERVATVEGLSPEKQALLARRLRERAADPDARPLSFAQERLWFLDRLTPGSAAYNLTAVVRMRGRLDVRALAASLLEVVRRHEALRTRFPALGGRPVQWVGRPALPLPLCDLGALPGERRQAAAKDQAVAANLRPFDLAAGPPLRALLVVMRPDEHLLALTLHHIVSDGWSVGVLVGEVAALYDALAASRRPDLQALPIQYVDFARWQRRALAGEALGRQLAYWRRQLAGAPPVLELPADRRRPAVARFAGARRRFDLPPAATGRLRRRAQEQGATLFMALLAGLVALLRRVTGQDDLVVGSVVANRNRAEIEGLIGFFVNALVLRTDASGEPSFGELLRRVREVALGAFAHQDLPFEKLVSELRPERGASHNPLFQVAFVLQNTPLPPFELAGLTLELLETPVQAAIFDLKLEVWETADGGVRGNLQYDRDLFDGATAARLTGQLERLMGDAAAHPERPLSELALLGGAERHQLLREWNGQAPPVAGAAAGPGAPRDGGSPAAADSLVARLRRQAAARPGATAVVYEQAELTYGDLWARSRRLARRLRGMGVADGERVGVWIERSPELVVAILGVLAAGAAYVPLDPDYPEDRLRFMLADAAVARVVSAGALAAGWRERLGGGGDGRPLELVRVDEDEAAPAAGGPGFAGRGAEPWDGGPVAADRGREAAGAGGEPAAAGPAAAEPWERLRPGSAAYVIYTSGSTGVPKGVVVPHGAVLRLFAATAPWFEFGAEDVWTLFHSCAFDFSVWELWGALLHGGRLVVVPYWVSRSPEAFWWLLAEAGVTVLNQTPSAFRQLLAVALAGGGTLPLLRRVIFGGEALDLASVASWWEEGGQQAALVNMYGITETTVHVTHRPIGPADLGKGNRIGVPIPDLRVYVAGRAGELAPIGVAGELRVGGAGVAWGYLGRPALTAERFVPDPWSGAPGGRLYRSGDLARWVAAGELEYLGRIDHQVKIRGYRIEPGEIEAALAAHPEVRAAVVTAREGEDGDRRLVAYVVPAAPPPEFDRAATPTASAVAETPAPDAAGAAGLAAALRRHLEVRLPSYMVPAAFVLLEGLPVTPQGKLDRRALPAPEGAALAAAEYVAPRTWVEATLARIWAEMLRLDRIGATDDFFRLGGHSLLATQVVSQVREVLGVELPLRVLFELPQLAGLAAAVEKLRAEKGLAARPAPPLVRVARREGLPLSFGQERLWFLDRLSPGGAAYNEALEVHLHGELAVAALERALLEIVARHEALRTVFPEVGGRPVQRIEERSLAGLPVADLRALPAAARERELARVRAGQRSRGFALAQGPLVRFCLAAVGERDHLLLATLHHIVFDGWSIGLLLREIALLYGAFAAGRPSPLPELPVQYADFASWQREWLDGEALAGEIAYWRQRLAGLAALELPADRQRPAVRRFHGGRRRLRLPAAVVAALRALGQAHAATLFMTLLAGFQALLGRLSGQDDVAVGSPTASRDRAATEGLIGFFVNMLVLRADLAGDPPWERLLDQVRETALAAYAHQHLPFEKLVEELRPQRDLSRNPLFAVSFQVFSPPPAPPRLAGLEMSLPAAAAEESVKFDLDVSLVEGDPADDLEGLLLYDRDLFEEATAERIARQLPRLLAGAAANPGRRLSELPLLAAAERFQLLVEWNDTASRYPRDSSVGELFAAAARRAPDAVAVVQGPLAVTYGRLDRLANRLARRLRALGVGPEERVALCCERSPGLVAALAGILAAGGAYVPLEPSHPPARLARLLADARPRAVVAGSAALAAALPPGDWPVVVLGDGEAGPDGPPPPVPGAAAATVATVAMAATVAAGNLAYVLYTSGTTGEPKGVAVVHRGVVRLVMGSGFARFGPAEVFLLLSPVGFDASTLELWGCLLHGGRLVLPEAARPSLAELGRTLVEHGVTTLWLTAALFEQMAAERPGDLAGVRQLLAGGDVLPPDRVRHLLGAAGGPLLINGYGPTENTTFTSCHAMRRPDDLPAGRPVPIGTPVANSRVYVLDASLRPVPLGVPGELCAAGDGLARGYFGQPAPTAASFLPDPHGGFGERLYRTGDRARWLDGGVLEFLGRRDHQVKIRGFRIEPGEVEAALARHPRVRQAAVLAAGGGGAALGERRLVAYVAAAGGAQEGAAAGIAAAGAVSAAELRRFLAERLPPYMVPARFVLLPALPLTASGKLDRQALAALAPGPPGPGDSPLVAPRGPFEEMLAALWEELLAAGPVGAHDDFFALGGHSLLATRLVSRLRADLGIDLGLRTVFESPTLAEMAREVARAMAGDAPAAEPPLLPAPAAAGRPADGPLSFAQERLWFLDQLAPGNPFYNVPAAVWMSGRLAVGALAGALLAVVHRHQALRTVFPAVGGRPVQRLAAAALPLPVVDLMRLPQAVAARAADRLAVAEAGRPFDLTAGPVVRARLVATRADEHLLLLTLHHVVADGWSVGVLVREVAALYAALAAGRQPALPELPIQYGDFARWQRRWLQGEVWERQLGYWKEKLGGPLPALELPADRRRPAVQRFRGARLPVALPAAAAARLRQVARERGATLFMALFGGFVALLHRTTGQDDLVVGSVVANRNRAEIEGLIGFFVNSLALRTDASGQPSFARLLGRVREVALGAYAHQDLPFEKLVSELRPERDMSHNPLFQVVFVLQNAPQAPLELAGLRLAAAAAENHTSIFDLKLELWEAEGGAVRGSIQYDTDLFDAPTIARLAGHFERLVADAADRPERRIGELALLGEAERHLLLAEWNGQAQAPALAADDSLAARFLRQAAARPEAIAVVCDQAALTYGELASRAWRLARRLRRLGVAEGERVGVWIERSPELVVAILGVLAAGAAYVPLDPDYPEERLRFMLTDAAVARVVSAGPLAAGWRERLAGGDGEAAGRRLDLVRVDEDDAGEASGEAGVWEPGEPGERGEPGKPGGAEPWQMPGPESAAYVIYTSGSTGVPKGVVVPHGTVLRLFTATAPWYGFGAADVWTLFHSSAFDFSVWELWGALLHGGRLVVVPYWVSRSPEAFWRLLAAAGVTVLNQTPSAFRQLLAAAAGRGGALPPLRRVIFGGEALELGSVRGWWEGDGERAALVNMYGITETTVHVTYRPVGPADLGKGSRIGVPIPDLRAYVAGSGGELSPIGVAGELQVGGAGVAQGYLNRPALTAERFVPDPWSGVPGGRLYRSGDLARWVAAGELEYLGRIDHQVKVRGYRIEPGEIEAALAACPEVREAAVVVREGAGGDRRLVAYVVPAAQLGHGEGERWQTEQVRRWRQVFEDTYGGAVAAADADFNLAGWTSAETGAAIPAEQMREWLADTVDRLAAAAPRRVLEIGCGTGMVLLRLAPGRERYVGTDLSRRALAELGRVAAARPELGAVTLLEREAADFSGFADGEFDAVVLNSVVQYFPSASYLEAVLSQAMRVLAPGGMVFVGDVRSLPLLPVQHLALALARAEGSLPVAQLEQRARQQAAQETELVLAPELFLDLARRLPGMPRVEIAPKRGRWHNELTRYRYQVALHAAGRGDRPAAAAPVWLDWQAEGLSLEALRQLLAATRPETLLLRRVPNARLRSEAALLRQLAASRAGTGAATVAELRRRLAGTAPAPAGSGGADASGVKPDASGVNPDIAGVEPDALAALGAELGYEVDLGWYEPGSDGAFEAGLRRAVAATPERGWLPAPPPGAPGGQPASWASSPRRGQFARQLAPALRRRLEARLPSYMVPAAFVLLEALPVTPQGKLDRRALPEPEGGRPAAAEEFVAPRTGVEETLARIWSEVLGVERVGAADDFFHLGGHSLLATQMISQVRAALGVELPLRALFEAPRLSGLAAAVERELAGDGAGARPAPPLVRVARRGALPLSFAQERLWFLDRLNPGGSAYNEPFAVRLAGRLDVAALERSLLAIVARHEALRTVFPDVEGRPMQLIEESSVACLPVVELAALPLAARGAELARLREAFVDRGFSLARGPLLRLCLLRLGEREHWLLATLHHIVFDGWSTGVLLRELAALYTAFLAGRPGQAGLPELPVQYADFAAWQRRWLDGETLAAELDHWRRRLAGIEPLELPADRPRPAVQRFRGGRAPLRVPGPLAARLRNLGQAHAATLFMTLLAGFQVVMGRLSGQRDVAVGSPIAGRDRAETERLIGFFVNMLVLRADLAGDPPFGRLLDQVRETALAAYAHQHLPFERLVEELRPRRDLARNPLFAVSFQLLNTPLAPPRLPGLELAMPAPAAAEAAKFDLDAALVEGAPGDDLAGVLVYDRDLFDAASMTRLAGHLVRLLAGAAADPGRRLSELSLLAAAERCQLLVEWNDTAADWPPEATVDGLVAGSMGQTPHGVAVVCGAASLTYGELDRRARRLAARLRGLGVGPEDRVALCLERSAELVVVLLGVLRAGGAYLPLDASHPRERLAFQLADATPRLLLASRPLLAGLPAFGGPVLCIDDLIGGGDPPERAPAPRAPGGEGLAYVLYTSGSTGEPKGVGVPHRALVNFLQSMRERPGLRPGETLLALTTLAFDIAALEILLPLVAGGTVALVSREVAADGARLGAALAASGAAAMQATPSTWRMLREAGWQGSAALTALSGGEALTPDLAAFLAAGCAAGWNLYGPTETTVWSAIQPLAAPAENAVPVAGAAPAGTEGPIPLGRPIANTRCHLLDGDGGLAAAGAPGELWIGGAGLARGYLGRPGLTAERFRPDPFGGEPGERLYGTGDLVRRRPDGTLLFLGRRDHQVKVRGVRIELGEVEAALARHPAVAAAVAAAGRDPSGEETRLAAYAVLRPGAAANAAELRGFLRGLLPETMVPAVVMLLPALPLTANGKLDRRALPAPAAAPAPRATAALRTPYEEALAAIWEEVLGVAAAGPGDSFFDLGGHSLAATRLLARIRRTFAVELPLAAVFSGPTLGEMAAALAAAAAAGGDPELSGPAVPLRRLPAAGGPLPLSFAQERLWFLDRLVPGNPFYNVPAAVRIEGELVRGALEAALAYVPCRQAALRARFPDEQGRPHLLLAPAAPRRLPLVDLSTLPAPRRQATAATLAAADAARPFDLARGPVLRACLLRLAGDEHLLLLAMHHIVSDGWSIGILVGELSALYGALARGVAPELPELPVQYHDFAGWQRAWLAGPRLERQLAYWRQRLAGHPPALALPFDRPRPAVQRFRGRIRPVTLPPALAGALKELGRRQGTTLFMTLLAAWQTLLARWTGQDDVVVGTPVANRRLAEVEGVIGFFANTLALRTDLAGDPPFAALLARVREEALAAYVHQDLPFEKLVEDLQPERDTSQTPLFQVMLVLQNAPLPALELAGLRLSLPTGTAATARFDLTLELQEAAAGLHGSIQYSPDLFDAATVGRLAAHLETLLAAVVAAPAQTLSRLPLLGPAELHQLLVELNDTRVAAPAETPAAAPVHLLFARQAARTPDAVALVGDGGGDGGGPGAVAALTYAELARRAGRLARELARRGVGPEVPVGICLERSLEMVVALLAVLEAGGLYVPLDPTSPPERLALMLETAAPPVLLTRGAWPLQGSLGAWEPRTFDLAAAWQAMTAITAPAGEDSPGGAASWPRPAVMADHPAYLLFTSGSTGRPKGVVVSHRALVNHMLWMQRRFPLDASGAVLQKTSLGFDASVWEVWAPLLSGARLVLARPGAQQDPGQLVEAVIRHQVTALQVVPALLRLLVDQPGLARAGSLQRVFCGGEALEATLAPRLWERLPAAELVNLYGPTETTIQATFAVWRPGDPRPGGALQVPIGRPIDNVQAMVLDRALQPAPPGAAGELYLGGAGLARGYHGRPDLTAERFVPAPFPAPPGARLYRSGDLVRLTAGGSLEFLGRADRQIKLRGHRIELGEIEAAIAAQPGVRECVVEPRGAGAGRRLVAYLVAEPHHPAGAAAGGGEGADGDAVAQWRKVFDETFRHRAGEDDETFNIVGWNSSYTGLPIPAAEMREWLDATLERILALRPRRVLEIGCGAGLLLLRIAPHTTSYVGMDFSRSALEYLRQQLQRADPPLPQVALEQRAADDFSGIAPGSFDLVVLNSVAQYFPGVDYLLRVLDGATAAVAPGGAVFVGDVRSLPLQEAFRGSVELSRAAAATPAAELRRGLARRLGEEKELLLDPAFFHALGRRLPRVREVAVELKRGAARNELTRFRYDVVLAVEPESGAEPEREEEPLVRWLAWGEEGLDLASCERRLVAERPAVLAVAGVPDARVAADLAALELLGQEGTAEALRARVAALAPSGVDPDDFRRLAAAAGYDAAVGGAGTSRAGSYDVVLARRPAAARRWLARRPSHELPAGGWESYANRPHRGVRGGPLVAELRARLQASLPAAMIPGAFVLLEAMPLNASGKLDRRALPDPAALALRATADAVAPRNALERQIAGIWQDVLGLGGAGVGVHENFFDLGGHSLLVVQVHDRLQAALGRELAMVHLFQYPTIAALAAFLTEAAAEPDREELAAAGARAEARREAVLARQRQRRRERAPEVPA
jgi:amino acid adenylation domain-containing protein